MATLRKGTGGSRLAARAGQPGILLDSESPYGSRRVVVEYDGATTAAYLHDADAIVGAAWVANHQQAPASTDLSRLDAGRAPLMPAGHTKHPGGRPPLDARGLRALWFEEGDGVAIIEGGQLLAVIPGWSDMSRGMPGYSRDVLGQSPFGWSLDDAMEGLGPRADRATAFWRWRQREDSWAGFQQSMLGHLLARLGPGARYWNVGSGKLPSVGVSERPPTEQRPYTVLSTLGMSCQRMPVVEQVMEDPSGCARIELAIATTMPSPEVARIFLWLAQYPWRAVTWFGAGHSIHWYHEPATFPLGGGNEGVLLLDDPG
ncbi:MAG TPA: suppressor of fused domain protein, partial [Streptosporangiaceae bacterium]|nr:suppressor of fused domain protein [Streptosporangiaceae bacterium]